MKRFWLVVLAVSTLWTFVPGNGACWAQESNGDVTEEEPKIEGSAGMPQSCIALNDYKLIGGRWAEDLKRLENEKNYTALLQSSNQFIEWLNKVRNADPKSAGPDVFANLIGSAYMSKASGLNGQGWYGIAANTLRAGYQILKENKLSTTGFMEKAMKYEDQKTVRNELWAVTMKFQENRTKTQDKVLDLSSQKQKLIDTLMQQKQVTPAQMKELQGKIRALNKEIGGLNKEISRLTEDYKKTASSDKFAGIIFNPNLSVRLEEMEKAYSDKEEKERKIDEAVKKGLLDLAEKSEQSWKGLQEKMRALNGLQKDIQNRQRDLLKLLSAKMPWTDDMKARMKELNAHLDKLTEEYKKQFQGIEDSFMNAEAFQNLTDKERSEFKKMLAEFNRAKIEIDANNAKIDDLIGKVIDQKAKWGDLNGDGVIDKKDLVKLLQNLGKKAAAVANADVDGDGKITWGDFWLIREAANGIRKIFPVDQNYVRGDVNGDGQLDWADLFRLGEVVRRAGKKGIKVKQGYQKMFDVNDDGILNQDDFAALVKKISEPTPVPDPTTPPDPIGGQGLLCEKCSQMSITKIYMQDAKCSACPTITGHTAYKYCSGCSSKLGCCRMCGIQMLAAPQNASATTTVPEGTNVNPATGETVDTGVATSTGKSAGSMNDN